MPLLTETEVRARADRAMRSRQASAHEILAESIDENKVFDVFLSHSTSEPERILLGVKSFLEDEGLSVYVDKYTDSHLSPEHVTIETAKLLRRRLSNSKSLLYIYSNHSKLSRWMPWELGFMDGKGRRIGIAPVSDTKEDVFAGEDFLGLYPYLDRGAINGSGKLTLWIQSSSEIYAELAPWIRRNEEIQLHR
ncbi:TIR domain-containing protein [Methylobacterium radiotolerans]|uniref:toll/interleukin-1 receptor domain-containing protein n=1 Tax=Methylobacterium radiotolerans TaxID=31998 RepID=UPI001057EF6D|nr:MULTISPECIES: toll/interleukin-1 receptor domain-containing protein [Methylobacterium]MDE3749573.1 toll/interleukin-1 receptor domain-containing protein [Methylobacterium radiotolerans]